MTPDDHRALARDADQKALRASTQSESRALRRQANQHRLDALLVTYRLNIEPPAVTSYAQTNMET